VSIDFEPVRVGPGRRRSNALIVCVLAAVVSLAVAVAKPWEAGQHPTIPPPAAIAAAATTREPAEPAPALAEATPPTSSPHPQRTRSPNPGPRFAQRDPFRGAPPPTWADLQPALAAHDDWGVRAVIVSFKGYQMDPRPQYLERWSATAPGPEGVETAIIRRDSRSIIALGFTFPAELRVESVQILRLISNGDLVVVDASSVKGGDSAGAFLYLRPGVAGPRFVAWDAGEYRIDMVIDGRSYQVAALVPGAPGDVRTGNGPPPPDEAETGGPG
jgi:hypothetical protein